MELTEFTKLLENSVHQIDELLLPGQTQLTIHLQDFYRIIQEKTEKNAETLKELKKKTEQLQKKENRIRQELEALHERSKSEINFKDEIIVRNRSLIMQQETQHQELLTHERNVFQSQIALKQKMFNNNEEQAYKQDITKLTQQLEKNRTDHMATERQRLENWTKMKQELDDTLLKYDSHMFRQQDQLESITQLFDNEKKELKQYQEECNSQDTTYQELMNEKEEYLENVRQQKIYEIRVKMAKRTIVKFIEQYYPAWKKKKLKAMKKRKKYKYKR